MPRNDDWQSRIKSVDNEYKAMRQASERFRKMALDDPSILEVGSEHRHLVAACANLESTYLIRLFAEFETGARQFWASQKSTKPNTAALLKGLASRCRIPSAELLLADSVRKYRNCLVHEFTESPKPIPLAEARGYLCRFFAFLPPRW